MAKSKAELEDYVNNLNEDSKKSLMELLDKNDTPNTDTVVPKPYIKLATFSGENLKGEVTYKLWRYDVNCLVQEKVEDREICRAIRRSLKGLAADVLHNLGEKACTKEILEKFDETFGNVKSLQSLIALYYTSQQKSTESVTQWSCRLEDLLTQIGERQKLSETQRSDMLKDRFWYGLYNEEIKSAIRHRYDNEKPYNELLSAARTIEDEVASKVKVAVNTTKVDGAKSTLEDKLEKILQQMALQDKKISALQEQVVRSGNPYDARNVSHDSPSHPVGGQNFNGTPGNRGTYRGRGRGRGSYGRSHEDRQCYKCGNYGHIRKDCPLN